MDCANGKTPRSPAYPWLSDISGLLERLINCSREAEVLFCARLGLRRENCG